MGFTQIRQQLIQETKQKIKQSITEDLLVIQAATAFETLNGLINTLTEKLRNWHELYNPEFSHKTKDNKVFSEQIANEKMMQENETMGGNLDDKDLQAIKTLAKTIQEMQKTQQEINKYIETKLSTLCQNTTTIIGTTLTAKLLTIAGSLKKLATMPASTIQLLGAEKALFRHIKQGTKTPKYGIISQHPLIQKQSMKLHGKAARKLADKIAITAKIDYFKGTFIGDKIKKELEKRIT